MKTLRLFETSETLRPVAQRHSLHDRCRCLCLSLPIVSGHEWAVLAQYGMWCGGVVSGKRRLPSTKFTKIYGRASMYLISLCSAIPI
jgi:hypothetical protein